MDKEETNTPDWLTDIQAKSWEPEILISGLTLTSLFFLPQPIFNFFGMLIQDYGVWQQVSRSLYIISMTMLTGLKIVLIAHLVLRGIWTAFIGLSAVFPHGVRRENLLKGQRDLQFDTPAQMVVRIGKVSSLLFSFIFSTIVTILGMLLILVPITLLFFTGLDLGTIRTMVLFVILPGLVTAGIVLAILLSTKLKNSKLNQSIDRLSLANIFVIYFTNIGRARTILMFTVYFLVVFGFSTGEISRFSFRNDREDARRSHPGVITADRDHYETTRDPTGRIQRATLDSLRTAASRLELFVAFYKEDEFSIVRFSQDDALRKKAGLSKSDRGVWVQDLYTVMLDGKAVSGLQWCFTGHPVTGQPGLVTTIPLGGAGPGFHELKIRKRLWSVKKGEMFDLERWVQIPFEVAPSGSS